MIQKIYDSSKNSIFIFLVISIIVFSSSCSTPERGSYNKYRKYSTNTYRYRGGGGYRANKNAQPIAKNYRIRNSRTSGRY